jgi:hypothetical protein
MQQFLTTIAADSIICDSIKRQALCIEYSQKAHKSTRLNQVTRQTYTIIATMLAVISY